MHWLHVADTGSEGQLMHYARARPGLNSPLLSYLEQVLYLEGEVLDLKGQLADMTEIKGDLEGHIADLSQELAGARRAAEKHASERATALQVRGTAASGGCLRLRHASSSQHDHLLSDGSGQASQLVKAIGAGRWWSQEETQICFC